MMHLTEDQIYHLVEAIGNHETLTAEEEQQMEHIRSCKECMAVRRTGIPCHDRYVFLPDAVLGTGNGRYR